MLWVAAMYLPLSRAGIVCHVYKTEQCWVCMACSSFMLCCEVLLLLNMADIWIVFMLRAVE